MRLEQRPAQPVQAADYQDVTGPVLRQVLCQAGPVRGDPRGTLIFEDHLSAGGLQGME